MSQQQWYVVRGGKEEGPHTETALKDMAASGKLKPTDVVRRADVETARPAGQIKGLFPGGDAPPPTPPAGQPTAAAPSSKKRLVIVGVIAGAVLLCGLAVLGMVVSNRDKQAAQKELAEANALWSADKEAAAAKYRSLLQNRGQKKALKTDELASVYGRLIDFEIEQGNKEAAKALLDEATAAKVTPSVNHPDAKVLVSATPATQPSTGPSAPAPSEEVLTADYYTVPSGTKRQTLGRLYVSDGVSAQQRKEYRLRA